ncbi:MAG: rhomboid family intramembrane serine protease [Tannerella sp.]|jgi:membrane associated rhomboid family serine protease|nr:rhomboid family intramembrane serine protease [Tannerella sp.]
MFTYLIIAANVLISFSCFSNSRLFYQLAFVPYRAVRHHEWYRLATHGFVHADTTHLLINMFTFWSFGTFVEKLFEITDFSKSSYIGLYFGGMIIASIHDLVKQRHNPDYVSVGASGAVSAVLFASILFNPWDKILLFAVLPIPGIVFGILYLLYCQYMARKGGDHINHNAHFYGAVYGFIYPILLNPELLGLFTSRLLG